MPWITLTSSDLKLTAAEAAALRANISSDGGDPIDSAIESSVNEVRGYIAGHRANILGIEGTIPSVLKDACLALARYRALNSLPVKSLLTDQRNREKDDAIKLLERVADGKFGIETPTEQTTETQQGAGTIKHAQGTDTPSRAFTEDTLAGL